MDCKDRISKELAKAILDGTANSLGYIQPTGEPGVGMILFDQMTISFDSGCVSLRFLKDGVVLREVEFDNPKDKPAVLDVGLISGQIKTIFGS